MKTLLYANRAEPKSISVISILLLAAVGAITKLRCMHRECYIFASQNLWLYLCFAKSLILVYFIIPKDLIVKMGVAYWSRDHKYKHLYCDGDIMSNSTTYCCVIDALSLS